MIAAHIEAAYSGLMDKLPDVGLPNNQVADLGWRFLEKIVQLPLTLPAIEASQRVNYFESLFREAVTYASGSSYTRDWTIRSSPTAIRRATKPNNPI